MRTRPALLAANSPDCIEVIQLTDEPEVPTCHVYMEAQIFAPDSKRFVLHRPAKPHGSDRDDPQHQYLLCDLEDECQLTPLTHEIGVTAPSVGPDGRWLYYLTQLHEPGRDPARPFRFLLDTRANPGRTRPARRSPQGASLAATHSSQTRC